MKKHGKKGGKRFRKFGVMDTSEGTSEGTSDGTSEGTSDGTSDSESDSFSSESSEMAPAAGIRKQMR